MYSLLRIRAKTAMYHPEVNVLFGLFAVGWRDGFETLLHPPILHISNTNTRIPLRILSI